MEKKVTLSFILSGRTRSFLFFMIFMSLTFQLYAQGDWDLLDEKLEMVMSCAASDISGNPDALAERYEGMESALAWHFLWYEPFHDLDPNALHWIKGGVFETESDAIDWWEGDDLDIEYGTPGVGDNGVVYFQNPNHSFNEYTATISAFGIDDSDEPDTFVEGTLSWRVGRFIFQVGTIQRDRYNNLISLLQNEGGAIDDCCDTYDLFDDTSPGIDHFQIDFSIPNTGRVLHKKDYELRIYAVLEDGSQATTFNTTAQISVKTSSGNQLEVSHTLAEFNNGECIIEEFRINDIGNDLRLYVTKDNLENSSDLFRVIPDLGIHLFYEGTLNYSNLVLFNAEIIEYDHLVGNIVPYEGEGTVSFSEENDLGAFANDGNALVENGIASINYTCPSENEMQGLESIKFHLELVIPLGEKYNLNVWFEFPGLPGGGGEAFPYLVSWGGQGEDLGKDVSGNLIIGNFEDEADFGSGIVEGYGSDDVFIAKMNEDDELDWLIHCGSSTDDDPIRVIADSGTVDLLFNSGNDIHFDDDNVVNRPTSINPALAKFDENGNYLWGIVADQTTKAKMDFGHDLALDVDGDLILTGNFSGDIIFDSFIPGNSWTGLPTGGDRDMFIVKYSGDGDLLWGYSAGGPGNDDMCSGDCIIADEYKNIFVGGEIEGEVDFGLKTFTNIDGSFLLKLDENGTPNWVIGIEGRNELKAITLDNNNNIFLACEFQDDVNFNGLVLEEDDESAEMYLAKLNSSGDPIWIKQILYVYEGSDGTAFPKRIKTDDQNNLYITGSFTGTINFGEGVTGKSNGSRDLFIVKYDNDGNLIWLETAGGEGRDEALGLSIDPNGKCRITGYFNDEASFGESTLSSAGEEDIFYSRVSGSTTSVNEEIDEINLPDNIMLNQNYPNPFNPETTISFSIPENGFVTLILYDITGKKVTELLNEELSAGEHKIRFNASALCSGVYFYQLINGDKRLTQKMLLLQ